MQWVNIFIGGRKHRFIGGMGRNLWGDESPLDLRPCSTICLMGTSLYTSRLSITRTISLSSYTTLSRVHLNSSIHIITQLYIIKALASARGKEKRKKIRKKSEKNRASAYICFCRLRAKSRI